MFPQGDSRCAPWTGCCGGWASATSVQPAEKTYGFTAKSLSLRGSATFGVRGVVCVPCAGVEQKRPDGKLRRALGGIDFGPSS
jgi:hypothetical protein